MRYVLSVLYLSYQRLCFSTYAQLPFYYRASNVVHSRPWAMELIGLKLISFPL